MTRIWLLPLLLAVSAPAFAQTQLGTGRQMKSYTGQNERQSSFITSTDKRQPYRTATQRWKSYQSTTERRDDYISGGGVEDRTIGTDVNRLASIDLSERLPGLEAPSARLSPTEGRLVRRSMRDLAQSCVYQPLNCKELSRTGSGHHVETAWERNRKRKN